MDNTYKDCNETVELILKPENLQLINLSLEKTFFNLYIKDCFSNNENHEE